MGTHGASVRPRALPPARRATKSTNVDSNSKGRLRLNLADWPVARRLFAVIVAALLMGLVFGGLRVADAESSASQFSRTQQLAKLGVRLTAVVNDLQNERDASLVALITNNDKNGLKQLQAKTDSDLGPVRSQLRQIVNGGYPATIEADASTVDNVLSPGSIGQLHNLFDTALPGGDVVSPDYESVIGDILTLEDQVSLGNTDQSLVDDVQTLNALARAKDLTSQQLALLDQSMSNPKGTTVGTYGFLDLGTETRLQAAYSEEFSDEAAFQSTATQAENARYDALLGPQRARLDGETRSDNIEQAIFAVASGQADNQRTISSSGISYPLFIATQQLDPLANNPTTAKQDGITTIAKLKAAWDKGTDAKLGAMQTAEQFVAGNIVARATLLRQAARHSALVYVIITVAVLLVVLLLALLVARSVVLPLRRLRAGALDIASVQLPERVRLVSDNPESAASMEVAPIQVTSQDEIGQVARAFDQVHSEAIRLAGEQALLRSSFNAMFVNLSRRSQTLIERLARMIDTLEQNEDDPGRLNSLFSMDHLVTRMRRNSENLLLFAGHENPSKWSESVPVADIARAATSEIEQYDRVVLDIPPGVSVTGQAVSDVVHLLAELIENATIFSPKDTQVRVSMRELTSGGVLIEIVDRGIGISEARLADMNWRLDNQPTIDVSVSRHMGLFAVARLAERHRVRVRLRPAPPKGISVLVWLPESVIERVRVVSDGTSGWPEQPAGARPRAGAGDAALTASGYGNGHGLARGRMAEGSALGDQNGDFFGDQPLAGGHATSQLPVRVPRASMPPGTGASSPPDGQGSVLPVQPAGTSVRSAGNGQEDANGGAKALSARSAEQARSRLSGFQRGTRRAQAQGGTGGQAPRAGEGTDR